MEIHEQYPEAVRQSWRDEIEGAVAGVKRSAVDRWFRREWYKAEARSRWPEWRKKHCRRHEPRKGRRGQSRWRHDQTNQWR